MREKVINELEYTIAGGLQATTAPDDFFCPKGGEFSKWRDSKFNFDSRDGLANGNYFDVYSAREPGPYKFYAELGEGLYGDNVDIYFFDYAALWDFRLKAANWVMTSLAAKLEMYESIAFRAFQATHGHSAISYCTRCDPEQVALDREDRELKMQIERETRVAQSK